MRSAGLSSTKGSTRALLFRRNSIAYYERKVRTMKKFIIMMFLVITTLLCAGCKGQECPVPALSDIQENVIEETILWENVLIESWT